MNKLTVKFIMKLSILIALIIVAFIAGIWLGTKVNSLIIIEDTNTKYIVYGLIYYATISISMQILKLFIDTTKIIVMLKE